VNVYAKNFFLLSPAQWLGEMNLWSQDHS